MTSEPSEPEGVIASAGVAQASAQAIAPIPGVTITAQVAKAVAQAPEELGNLTQLVLSPLGNRPRRCPEIAPAWWRLVSTHESVTGLFDTLHLVRRTRADKTTTKTTRGRLHSDAQDLLRAAIVFTSAGLDASVQALIHHAVPILITKPGTARIKYETYVEEQARASSCVRSRRRTHAPSCWRSIC